MVSNYEMKHKFKRMLEMIRSSACFCSLFFYSMAKYPLDVTSATGTRQDTL